jgi:hypothetical protein
MLVHGAVFVTHAGTTPATAAPLTQYLFKVQSSSGVLPLICLSTSPACLIVITHKQAVWSQQSLQLTCSLRPL